MARKSGPVSIYSIAKELGISPSAVSRAVNNRAGVSEETRRNVMTLLRKYNFRTNYPQQRKPKIAIVSQRTLISQYVATVTSGIHDYVSENALSICSIVYDHEHDTEPLLSAIRDQQCSGVIVLNADDFKNDFSELNSSGLPVMLVDLPSQYPNIGFIDNDSYHGFHTATQHLLQLGHRRIGYLNPRKSFNHHQRFRGYCDAMHEAGLEIPDHWIQDRDPDELKTDIHHGARMLSHLLDAAPELTAIMAANDNFALGAIHATQARGLPRARRSLDCRLRRLQFQCLPESAVDHGTAPGGRGGPPCGTRHRPVSEDGRQRAAVAANTADRTHRTRQHSPGLPLTDGTLVNSFLPFPFQPVTPSRLRS